MRFGLNQLQQLKYTVSEIAAANNISEHQAVCRFLVSNWFWVETESEWASKIYFSIINTVLISDKLFLFLPGILVTLYVPFTFDTFGPSPSDTAHLFSLSIKNNASQFAQCLHPGWPSSILSYSLITLKVSLLRPSCFLPAGPTPLLPKVSPRHF